MTSSAFLARGSCEFIHLLFCLAGRYILGERFAQHMDKVGHSERGHAKQPPVLRQAASGPRSSKLEKTKMLAPKSRASEAKRLQLVSRRGKLRVLSYEFPFILNGILASYVETYGYQQRETLHKALFMRYYHYLSPRIFSLSLSFFLYTLN